MRKESMRIDYVNLLDHDAELWFFDGEYVGHDDQIGPLDFAPRDSSRSIMFFHRIPKEGIDIQDLDYESGLASIEAFLETENTPA